MPKLHTLALAGLLAGFMSGGAGAADVSISEAPAEAHPTIDSAHPGNTGSEEANAAKAEQTYTTANVPRDKPFGTIDMSGAGNTTGSVLSWAQSRTRDERAELGSRCSVIVANRDAYDVNNLDFCLMFMQVASNMNARTEAAPGLP